MKRTNDGVAKSNVKLTKPVDLNKPPKEKKPPGRPATKGSKRWIELNGINGEKTQKTAAEKTKKVSQVKVVATSEDFVNRKRKLEEDSDSDY